MLTSTAYWALIPVIVPGKAVGTASGLMHGLGNLSGVVAPALTGLIIERTHSYTAAFEIAGGLGDVGQVGEGVGNAPVVAERAAEAERLLVEFGGTVVAFAGHVVVAVEIEHERQRGRIAATARVVERARVAPAGLLALAEPQVGRAEAGFSQREQAFVV